MSRSSSGLEGLVQVMARLRAVDGCPWDREQTLATLRTYLVEESHELLEAIDALGPAAHLQATDLAATKASEGGAAAVPLADPMAIAHLREELGDVLLQIAFQSQIASEAHWFDLDAVARGIADKMIRRHPHVFGEAAPLEQAGEVRDRWEQQKRKEGKGALAGVPRSLPALLRAQRIGEKAARIGFDWPDAAGPWAKVDEELAELREATGRGDRADMQDELGDVLFALSSLARHLELDAEMGLRQTLDKFTSRFAHVEAQAEAHYGREHKASLDELEAWWQEAKRIERGQPAPEDLG